MNGPMRGVAAVALAALVATGCVQRDLDRMKAQDLDGARQAFLSNIAAIHHRDTRAYLADYLQSADFLSASPTGVQRGYAPFAKARMADSSWPDTLVAGNPALSWIAPGVVYGVYPYVVTQHGETTEGVSERVFVKTKDGWKIAVTSVIPAAEQPGAAKK